VHETQVCVPVHVTQECVPVRVPLCMRLSCNVLIV